MSRSLPILAGALVFAPLVTVCLFVDAPRIERDIRARSSSALSTAGLSAILLDVSGRDVTVSGRRETLDSVVAVLANVTGVRRTITIVTTQPAASAVPPVTQPLPLPPDANTVENRIRDVTAERPIRFRSGSAVLLAASRGTLDALAELLRDNDFDVVIEGHTDASGSAQRNLTLSQQRADAVKAYLVAQGIAADRLTATGVGAARPVAPNTTAAGRQRNRRIEFNISSHN